MSEARMISDKNSYKHLSLEGTRDALLVRFNHSKFVKADEILRVGKELLWAADVALKIDMPLVLSFIGVESISPALMSKLAVLRRKAESNGIKLSLCDIPPVSK